MLQLRDFYADDAPFLVQYLNDEQVTRFITAAIPKPYTLSDAKWWIEHSEGNPLIQAVCLDGQLIGCISAQPGQFEYQRSAELGYWLASPMWRQGYGSQAVALFVEQLKHTQRFKRLFVSVVTANLASIGVLQNNDFELEGTLKQVSCKDGHYFDEHIYAKLL